MTSTATKRTTYALIALRYFNVTVGNLQSADSTNLRLAQYSNVQVIEGDRGSVETGRHDAIFINAGVTHPTEQWLESMTIGGTLVLPITLEVGMPYVGPLRNVYLDRITPTFATRGVPAPGSEYVREKEQQYRY